MIIGRLNLKELDPALRRLQQQLGREVKPIIYRPEDLRGGLTRRAPFIIRVLAGPKIMLFGNPDDLGHLAGESLAHGAHAKP